MDELDDGDDQKLRLYLVINYGEETATSFAIARDEEHAKSIILPYVHACHRGGKTDLRAFTSETAPDAKTRSFLKFWEAVTAEALKTQSPTAVHYEMNSMDWLLEGAVAQRDREISAARADAYRECAEIAGRRSLWAADGAEQSAVREEALAIEYEIRAKGGLT